MPAAAELEVHTIHGRKINVRWKSSRHGEWLAWCYVAAPSMLPNEGVRLTVRRDGGRVSPWQQVLGQATA